MSVNTNVPVAAFAAGDRVVAAKLNEIRSGFSNLQAPWDPYTPTLTAVTTNPSVTYTTRTGRYLQVGKSVMGQAYIVLNTVSSIGSGALQVSLPLAPLVVAGTTYGAGWMQYANAASMYAFTARENGNGVAVMTITGANLSGSQGGVNLQAGSIISLCFNYEAA